MYVCIYAEKSLLILTYSIPRLSNILRNLFCITYGGRRSLCKRISTSCMLSRGILGYHWCSAGAIVEKSQLAKDIAFIDGLDHLLLTVHCLGAIQRALLNHKEEVTIVALVNDFLTGLPRQKWHKVQKIYGGGWYIARIRNGVWALCLPKYVHMYTLTHVCIHGHRHFCLYYPVIIRHAITVSSCAETRFSLIWPQPCTPS